VVALPGVRRAELSRSASNMTTECTFGRTSKIYRQPIPCFFPYCPAAPLGGSNAMQQNSLRRDRNTLPGCWAREARANRCAAGFSGISLKRNTFRTWIDSDVRAPSPVCASSRQRLAREQASRRGATCRHPTTQGTNLTQEIPIFVFLPYGVRISARWHGG